MNAKYWLELFSRISVIKVLMNPRCILQMLPYLKNHSQLEKCSPFEFSFLPAPNHVKTRRIFKMNYLNILFYVS